MGARSRRKGAAWERHVSGLLTAHGVPAERRLDECRSGGGRDLLTDAPLCVQCKVGGRPDIYGAVREAVGAAEPGELPLAIIRHNGAGSRPPDDLAVLRLGDLLPLLTALLGALEGS